MPEAPVVNALTVDVEEYYHGMEFTRALGVDGIARLPSRVVAETERLLDILDEHGARGTFFTLGLVAHRQPRLVRRIAERGHELASHGWDHRLVWELGPDGFRHDVRRARHAVEQASGLNRLAAEPIRRRGHDERSNRFWSLFLCIQMRVCSHWLMAIGH